MHWVQALVSSHAVLADLSATLRSAVVRDLPQGFALVPITDDLAAEISGAGYPSADPSPLPAREMVPGVAALAAKLSTRGPVAYVATFIHGGTGGQDGLVWEAGALTLNVHDPEDGVASAWPNSPVSTALRRIGVKRLEGEDEFDAVGLGRYRSNESWAEGEAKIAPSEHIHEAENFAVQPSVTSGKPWWKFWG